MIDGSRIEDLRRRIDKDPASILFAQLAEELRRAGRCQEAVDICRAGLSHHPTYVSARVTLGRSLLDLDQLDDAERELGAVQKVAPDNLTALRALALLAERRHPAPSACGPREESEPAIDDRRELHRLSLLERWLDAIHVARTHPIA
jgi:predicted Zn-dependent protease